MIKLLRVLRILLIIGIVLASIGVYYEVKETTKEWKQDYDINALKWNLQP